MFIRTFGMTSLLALCAAACNQSAPSDSNIAIDETVNAAEAANADIEVLPPDETAAPPIEPGPNVDQGTDGNGVDPVPEPGPAAAIPAQYHGRWGMVPTDCTSTRGDAKGLMTVEPTRVTFYESRGKLVEQRPAIATSFSGLFAFTGEGQNWQKVMTFTRTGDTLKRAEDGGTYTYKRCG